LKVVGYIRCSTTEQSVEGVSLETQRGRINAWCSAIGAELFEVIEDAGISGTRALIDRPGCSDGPHRERLAARDLDPRSYRSRLAAHRWGSSGESP
jgi:hypothetical protein